ncbi:MAG: TIGR00282 family metallophosphoesterase [Syntrophales bacterium]|jgi:metallophosphoesterase (TIGR00282 family)|nr:TIGR00282 family metallophosphoesterase [Syntrophales bacterium]NLN60362.1 TIGR00282 family metallophosphoesterase [Deltaproteobacteria bacterium]
MKILFIGDIMGKPGRRAVRELLPKAVKDHDIDFVIANCENAASGFGVTRDIVDELLRYDIDVLTSGNHIWDKKEVMDFIDDYENLLRPANYPGMNPGYGSTVLSAVTGDPVGVINLEGRVFMRSLDCPFKKAKEETEKLKGRAGIVIVDMHAEATSEKRALGWFLDGQVTAVLGTHTHVQTADNEVLPGGTAYITDVGMTGPFDSVIGIKTPAVLDRFLSQIPNRFDVAKRDIRMQGVVLDVDEETGKSRSIMRISVKLEEKTERGLI